MSAVVMTWSAFAAVAATLGGVHVAVWLHDRNAWANLMFSLSAFAVAAVAMCELALMHTDSIASYAQIMRWGQVPVFFLQTGIVMFVLLHFRTGRRWLAWAATGMRSAAVVLGFFVELTLQFRSIHTLKQVPLLGEKVWVVGGSIPNPWSAVGSAAGLLAFGFVADASLALWRQGGKEARRCALFVGASIVVYFAVAVGTSTLINTGMIEAPYLISIPFLAIIVTMGAELSRDVIRAARMAEELRESTAMQRLMNDRFRLSVEASPNGVMLADVGGRILLVNERAARMFGYSDGELIGKQVEELVPERFRGGHAGERGRFHAAPTTRAMGAGRELFARRKDGTEFPVEIGLNPIDSAEGMVVLSVIVDITARKQAEEALRESEARFSMVANSAPVMIWMAATDKLCTFFNKGWLAFTGRTIEQELGNGWADGVHADDFERCVKTYHEAFDARQAFTMEYRLRRGDGEYCWVLDNGVPRFAADGAFLGYIGTAIDISALRHAQSEAARQREELAHVARVASLTELSGSLAHELNQPLAIILSNAQAAQRLLARATPDVAEVREILNDIVEEDQRAGEVIKRLRALIKRGQIEPVSLSLNDAVDDVMRVLHADLIARGVTVVRELDAGLPTVFGDRVQFQQVVLNLITNGADAMADTEAARRRLHLTTTRYDGVARLSVRDHGCGLPADIEQLFTPFHTTKAHGLGMGLAICRTIVVAHRGRLWAEPHTECGAVFHLELPVHSSDVP